VTLNKEAIRQRSEELQKGESDFSYLKLTESGSPHHVRILPAWNDSGIPWKEAYFHYGVNERTLACPKSNVNQPCPICDLVDEAAASKKKGDKKFADEMSSKFRAFLNVVDMKNQDAGVQVWPVGKMILKQVTRTMKTSHLREEATLSSSKLKAQDAIPDTLSGHGPSPARFRTRLTSVTPPISTTL